jgi:hypothetical protein
LVEVVFEVVVVREQAAATATSKMMTSAQLMNAFERTLRERKVNTMIDTFYIFTQLKTAQWDAWLQTFQTSKT